MAASWGTRQAGRDVELTGEAEEKENRGWFWNQQQASPTRASETVYRPRLAHS